jgi:hypothetical protein
MPPVTWVSFDSNTFRGAAPLSAVITSGPMIAPMLLAHGDFERSTPLAFSSVIHSELMEESQSPFTFPH